MQSMNIATQDITTLDDYLFFFFFFKVKIEQCNISTSKEKSIHITSIAFCGIMQESVFLFVLLFKGIIKSLHCMKNYQTPQALPLSHIHNRSTIFIVIAAQLQKSRDKNKYI